MHPNNLHQNKYNIDLLCSKHKALSQFVFVNKYGTKTINFSKNNAVNALNTALLKTYYKVDYWMIPKQHLCPAVPGRSDYIHHLNDLLQAPKKATILDIGRQFGYNIVIEGIEKEQQKKALLALDKELSYQGYLYSKPTHTNEFTKKFLA